MPVLDLGDLKNKKSLIPALRLFATMLYPDDATKRDQLLAAESISGKYRGGRELLEITSYQSLVDRGIICSHISRKDWDETAKENADIISREAQITFEASGGEQTLLHAPGLSEFRDNNEKVALQGTMAGFILFTVMQMNKEEIKGGASFNKVVYLIDNYHANDLRKAGFQMNSLYVKKSWRLYKPVAHLWAAHNMWQFAGSPVDSDPYGFVDSIEKFFALAEVFRKFGESFYPSTGRQEPLLKANETWRPPDNFIEFKAEFNLPKLSKGDRDALKKYKAPN